MLFIIEKWLKIQKFLMHMRKIYAALLFFSTKHVDLAKLITLDDLKFFALKAQR